MHERIRAVLNRNPVASGRREGRPAAVLVPLIQRERELHVLFTQRTDHLYDHPGQISFPGGRIEAGDRDAVHTALRESQEEIGLDAGDVDIMGFLDEYHTGTGFRVMPVVGYLASAPRLTLDVFEVAETFDVPLTYFMDPDHRSRQTVRVGERERSYYVFRYEHRIIWGATAGMLVDLCARLGEDRD